MLHVLATLQLLGAQHELANEQLLATTMGNVVDAVPSMFTPLREMSPVIAICPMGVAYEPVTWMPCGPTTAFAAAESPTPETVMSPASPMYQLAGWPEKNASTAISLLKPISGWMLCRVVPLN